MTPEEAIKTIRVAIAEVEWDYPLDYAIAFETAIEALENVNRQQVEIERLKIENQSLRSAANSYKLHYNEARAEAIKEFAEALKFVWYDNRYDSPDIDFEYLIDTIVEEMVGETE